MVKGLPLSSLPDGCILNLMTQLPPLARMHFAATCVRYQQIYKFGRLHSLVLSNSSESPPLGHLLSCADGCFPTLASAIHNSRCLRSLTSQLSACPNEAPKGAPSCLEQTPYIVP